VLDLQHLAQGTFRFLDAIIIQNGEKPRPVVAEGESVISNIIRHKISHLIF